MAEIRTLPTRTPAHQKNNYLRAFAKNVHSQMGEDGVIEAIFDRLAPANKWVVEFGAWDGVWLSNACRLIKESGWKAVLIEGDPERAARIPINYQNYQDIYGIQAFVALDKGPNSIDDILSRTPIPVDPDLISIDVDGNDYHIWKSIVDYRPRVVACEFNPHIPNGVIFIQDADPNLNEGNSLSALIELGKLKGYELICVSHSNAFFVDKQYYDVFDISDNSVDAMVATRPNYLWPCYNGKLYNSLTDMRWGGKYKEGFGPESLQYAPRFGYLGRQQGVADTGAQSQQLHGILQDLVGAVESGSQELIAQALSRAKEAL